MDQLKSYENQTKVNSWITSRYQSDLDTLGLGITGGKADPATTPGAAGQTTAGGGGGGGTTPSGTTAGSSSTGEDTLFTLLYFTVVMSQSVGFSLFCLFSTLALTVTNISALASWTYT